MARGIWFLHGMYLIYEPRLQDEFGMGSFNVFSAHGPAVSPLVAVGKPGAREAADQLFDESRLAAKQKMNFRAKVSWWQQRRQRRCSPHRERVRGLRH